MVISIVQMMNLAENGYISDGIVQRYIHDVKKILEIQDADEMRTEYQKISDKYKDVYESALKFKVS